MRRGNRPPPPRTPARRPGPSPAQPDPRPARPPQRAPAREPIADDPAATIDLTSIALIDLREAKRLEPALAGSFTAEAAHTPSGITTTEIRSSLLRFREDEDAADERPGPPDAIVGVGSAPSVEVAPSDRDVSHIESAERQVWPEIRFYLGCAALFFVTFALATGVWVLGPSMLFGWSSAAITSGSMEPAIHVGDVVVFSPPPAETIATGTVVVFEDGNGGLVTHRIVGYDQTGSYITRGDANPVEDSQPVRPGDVHGVGRLLVPFAGYPAVWMSGGSPMSVVAVTVGFGLLVFASRWALLPRFIPWPRER